MLFASITAHVTVKLHEVIEKKRVEMAQGNHKEGVDIYNEEMDMDFAS
jgi:hypothetical protein